MDERDWIRRRKLIYGINRFASVLIWISIVLLAVFIWFTSWSFGTKLFIFGGWFLASSIVLYYASLGFKELVDGNEDDKEKYKNGGEDG